MDSQFWVVDFHLQTQGHALFHSFRPENTPLGKKKWQWAKTFCTDLVQGLISLHSPWESEPQPMLFFLQQVNLVINMDLRQTLFRRSEWCTSCQTTPDPLENATSLKPVEHKRTETSAAFSGWTKCGYRETYLLHVQKYPIKDLIQTTVLLQKGDSLHFSGHLYSILQGFNPLLDMAYFHVGGGKACLQIWQLIQLHVPPFVHENVITQISAAFKNFF